MKPHPTIPKRILPSVKRSDLPPRNVAREFDELLASGAKLTIAGTAKHDPTKLFTPGLRPRHRIDLFETRFYLSTIQQIPELRFMVAYVVQPNMRTSKQEVFARIFYKDLSLIWRTSSHFSRVDDELWIGKGDVRDVSDDEYDILLSDESTTDLPLEMQTAVESLIAWTPRKGKEEVLDLVLRRGPGNRVEPYQDFTKPRLAAQSNAKNLINSGRSIAHFRKHNDPASLKITKGFEPDFSDGILERSKSRSRLYGGTLKRFRILSTNKLAQYFFFAGKQHVWIIPPQATTTELSSYGVRTIDVVADDDLFIPGYEYHHYEDTADGPELYSQIPTGFVGDICPDDDMKADAGPWLEKIPLIQQFRRTVLKQR